MAPTPPLEDLAAYSPTRAAQICRLPASTLRVWAVGSDIQPALFKPVSKSPLRLSFLNLTEAFVLTSMRRAHAIPMQKVRRALRYVGRDLGYERPLVHAGFRTDGVRLFVEHAGRLLDVSSSGQAALGSVLDASLERIDWERGFAARLYPWVRDDLRTPQPKTIVIDPRRGFGQPALVGTGILARIVVERHRAGESVADLAEDYGVPVTQVEDAIRCETREAA